MKLRAQLLKTGEVQRQLMKLQNELTGEGSTEDGRTYLTIQFKPSTGDLRCFKNFPAAPVPSDFNPHCRLARSIDLLSVAMRVHSAQVEPGS